jgi:hypothetical protein
MATIVVEESVETTETIAVAVCRTSEVFGLYLMTVVRRVFVTNAVAVGLVTVVVVVVCPHVVVDVR